MKIIRWFILPPACVVCGVLSAGIVYSIGQSILGQWQITSGLVIFFTSACYVGGWVQGGRLVAPQKNLAIQRAIAFPLLIVALVFVINTIKVLAGDEYPAGIDFHLSDSLSLKWQYSIFTLGFLVGLVGAFTEE